VEEKITTSIKLKADMSVVQPLYDRLNQHISKLEPELLKRTSEAFELLFNSGKLLFEITTVQSNSSSAGTRELLVTFYPTDCLLVFARTVFTGDFDSLIVKD
jgi:hypothetical protein